jgi:hypothetical protein
VTPHPRTSPDGHRAGVAEPTCASLTCHNWPSHETWLLGVDLYNQAYWWEAHEQWEAAWRLATPGQNAAHLLQGLIQLSAALLKWDLGNKRGRDGLWRKAREHLCAVSPHHWLGVEVPAIVTDADELFRQHPVSPTPDVWPIGPVIQLAEGPGPIR